MSAIGNIVGQLTGTSQAANAAKSAAQTEANAANYAANLQNQQFQTTQANLAPFMNAGTQALPQYLNLLGLGSQGTSGIQAALANMPGYQFALNQGLKASANTASGSGLNLSGAQQKGLTNYATGLANTNYSTYLTNLQNAVAGGQNAATGLGQLGQNAATNIGNAVTSGASATAAGQVAAGNAQQNLVNSLLQTGLGVAGIYSLGSGAGKAGVAGNGQSLWNSIGNLFSGSGSAVPAGYTDMSGFANGGSGILSVPGAGTMSIADYFSAPTAVSSAADVLPDVFALA